MGLIPSSSFLQLHECSSNSLNCKVGVFNMRTASKQAAAYQRLFSDYNLATTTTTIIIIIIIIIICFTYPSQAERE